MNKTDSFLRFKKAMVVFLCLVLCINSAIANDLFLLRKIAELETQLEEVDAELEVLASYNHRGGMGSIGYRSYGWGDLSKQEWVEVELAEVKRIDLIVIVPSLWRNRDGGVQADGFPLQFQVRAGLRHDKVGTLLAAFSEDSASFPRIAPLAIPCDIEASWVRLEAEKLSPLLFNPKQFNLELSELMVFSGNKNLALNQPVKMAHPDLAYNFGARRPEFLVDGQTPYLMSSDQGSYSIPYIGESNIGDTPSITIDLGEVFPVDCINIHSIESSDTFPQAVPSDFAFPNEILIEGAQSKDFHDAVTLVRFRKKSPYNIGPVNTLQFKKRPCRYVRITAKTPYQFAEENLPRYRTGFAEIEVFSGDVNVAYQKPVTTLNLHAPYRSLESLVDGKNLYGYIISIRNWMSELSRRNDLELIRPKLHKKLNELYSKQALYISSLFWTVMLLIVLLILIYVILKYIQNDQIKTIKHRITADLHDELGANIHAIRLLTDMAQQSIGEQKKISSLLERIGTFASLSGVAVRKCISMVDAGSVCESLVSELNLTASRLLADLNYSLEINGETFLEKISTTKKIHLLRFYKECLINSIRHSDASRLAINIRANETAIEFDISDDGCGMAEGWVVPKSLKRRAKLLGGKVTVDSGSLLGTRIKLIINIK